MSPQGMGGQLRYFGLFLDEQFSFGHSKAEPRCTTFGSPQLSAESTFQLDCMEVWGVGPVAKLTADDEGVSHDVIARRSIACNVIDLLVV